MLQTSSKFVVILPTGKTVGVNEAPKIMHRDGAWFVTGVPGTQPALGHFHGFRYYSRLTYVTEFLHYAEAFAATNGLFIEETD